MNNYSKNDVTEEEFCVMKRKASDFKVLARESMAGNYATPIGALIFMSLLTAVGSGLAAKLFGTSGVFSIVMSQVFSIVVSLIVSIFQAGVSYMFLSICRGKSISFSDVFYMFRHYPDRVIVVSIILTIIEYIAMSPYLIWVYTRAIPASSDITALMTDLFTMMLLMYLGIVIAQVLTLPFVLCYYLLIDDEEMSAIEAIKGSMAMMKGNYGRYIYLLLSFLGLSILGVCSCYIGFLWIQPYMQATVAEFYLELKGELDGREQHYRNMTDNSQSFYAESSDQLRREPDDYNSEA